LLSNTLCSKIIQNNRSTLITSIFINSFRLTIYDKKNSQLSKFALCVCNSDAVLVDGTLNIFQTGDFLGDSDAAICTLVDTGMEPDKGGGTTTVEYNGGHGGTITGKLPIRTLLPSHLALFFVCFH
jgi:hypothetical protein